ncbi:MAG: hypothetical protein ACI9FD_002204 [Gammaproteobacteria bacterium]|jgi:hypothetical protein
MRILPHGSIQFFRTPIVRVFLFLCLMGGVFIAGIVWSHLDNVDQRRTYLSAIDQAARLSGKNSGLEEKNAGLNARIIQLEHKLQIDRIAYEKLTSMLNESSEYISELRADLGFYQSIISPEDNLPGVKIHGFSVSASQNSSAFDYKLTLVQALNHDNLVKGNVSLLITGLKDGEPVEIDFADIGAQTGKLKFRYFQILSGKINLPEGVLPQMVSVKFDVKAAKKGAKTDNRNYVWQPEAGII